MHTLLILFLTPLVASLITFLLGRCRKRTIKACSFFMSLIPLVLLLTQTKSLIGTTFAYPWAASLSINFHLACDELTLVFLFLANVIIPFSVLASSSKTIERPNFYYGFILLIQALLVGFFTSQDLFCFTFFFEGMLLPVYFLITGWGSTERRKAANTFIIYMIGGSTFMVAAMLALYFSSASILGTGTFDLATLATMAEKIPYASFLAAIFLLAFLVKTPLFPFHAWLPNAYCQAPLGVTILLAAVLSKTGIYGLLRISIGLFPTLFIAWSPILLAFAIGGVLYGAFAAWGQNDFKKLIAYSSLSHINFVLAGLFVFNSMAQSGAILQAVNHAVTITALFLVAGWLEVRLGTTQFGNYSGLASYMPRLAWLSLFFVMSSVALPGLNNFVSEVMVLYGVFQYSWLLSALLGLTVIFSILYMLRWIHSVYFDIPNKGQRNLIDIKAKEAVVALPLIALIIWLGMYPKPVLGQIEPVAQTITNRLEITQ